MITINDSTLFSPIKFKKKSTFIYQNRLFGKGVQNVCQSSWYIKISYGLLRRIEYVYN